MRQIFDSARYGAHEGLLWFLALSLVGSLLLNSYQFLQPKGKPSCSSFGSYSDALASFRNGNWGLDDDYDGIPCETMKKTHGRLP